MQIDWWTFGFQTINVLVLIWLLSHFLFRPVAGIIATREVETQRMINDAEQAKSAAEKAMSDARAMVEADSASRKGLIEAARAEAEKQKAAILENAKQEAAKLLKSAEGKIARQMARARKSSVAEARKLALTIADKLVTNLPSGDRMAGYPERLADALKKLSEEQKSAVLGDENGVRLVSPCPMTKQELEVATKAIKAAAGHEIAIEVETDADLIAGLELRSRHGVIHNSLRADIDHISEALLSDE